jgi:23S rRNA G2069 N7-methylase RlmK/C1962 C5-methylase RlmI
MPATTQLHEDKELKMKRNDLITTTAVTIAIFGVIVGFIGARLLHADGTVQTQAALPTHTFVTDAGMILNFIKPEKANDFEAVMARLKEALQKSDKPERRQQAATWRLFKAEEPGANGTILYVFWINPAVKGADYTVSTVLAEAFPQQVQDLFKQYVDAYAQGQNVVSLRLVSSFGQ